MGNPLFKGRLWIIATGMCLFSILGVSAQNTCLVGGTNFDTNDPLCSPVLENNNGANGWLNPNLGTILSQRCNENYSSPISNAKHIPEGFQNNTMSTVGAKFPIDLNYRSVVSYQDANGGVGSVAIVANPRIIHPNYRGRPDDNILVSLGTNQNVPFFSYSVSGLAPNTSVTFSADVFSLLDTWAYVAGAASGSGGMSSYTGNANGTITGTPLVTVRVGSAISYNNSTGTTISNGTTSANIPWGGSINYSWTTTADANGNITFYVARGSSYNAQQVPIGLDNVRIYANTIRPIIASQKTPPVCPENLAILQTAQGLPGGTTYSWSANTVPPQTSTSEYFAFIPPAANQTYQISLSVNMDGCIGTAPTLPLTTKVCCTTAEGVPLAETVIFYDDFGTFPTPTTYFWTDQRGAVHQGSTNGLYWGNTGYEIARNPNNGSTFPGLATAGNPTGYFAGGNPTNVATIVYRNFYAGGARPEYDRSGTRQGGMLMIDLDGSGHANKVIYQREICGLCKGKKISFGAWFANANSGQLIMKIQLREGGPTGPILHDSGDQNLTGVAGWREAAAEFVLDKDIDCAVLQVVNVQASYGSAGGDLIIDDISFSVCTPPDIDMSYTLTGSADLLNLCDGANITFKAEVSPNVINYYGASDIRYLFQYTYDNPQTATNITWRDLGGISSSDLASIIDAPSHSVFSSLQNGQRVYFRLVVGTASYLANRALWESMDAKSPCREVSINLFPVVASLNCPKCTESQLITISSTASAPVVGGIKTVNLCPGENTTLGSNIITPTPAYTDYAITWHKDSKTSPAIAGYIADPGTTARALTVTHSNAGSSPVSEKYYIKVIDKAFPNATLCTKWDSILIVSNPLPEAGITNNTGLTVLTCMFPTISLTATGDGTYAWNNGLGSNANVTVNAAGDYTVTVTANGCTATASITITENKALPTAGITNNTGTTVLTCTTPRIDLTATGGESYFSYLWDHIQATDVGANVAITAPGTYTVTAIAANGCTATESITITEDKTAPTAGITNNSSTTVLSCTDPSISLTATSNGTYSWNNGLGSNADVTVTAPGVYTVIVTGANGCMASSSIMITEDGLLPTAGITNNTGTIVLTCTTSSISLTATGGSTYSWDNGLGNNANATVNAPGTYTVTATAANGCSATASITITENKTPPTVGITNNTSATELTCTLLSISLTATGGVSYSWDNGLGNNASATVISAGTYTVTVTGSNGCTATQSITITADKGDVIAGITNNTGETVLTCTTPSISLTATGTGSYTWSNGLGSNANVTVNTPGTYTVTITATNGCADSKSITITEDRTPPAAGITNNTLTTVLTCTNPTISLTSTGGGTYSWNNSLGSNATVTVNTAGTYVATVTGSNGCTATASVTITENQTPPTAGITNNTSTTVLTCTTPSISLTATGGVSYLWDNSLGSNANATVNAPGTYTVTVTGSNGCTATSSVTITESKVFPTAGITNNTGETVLTCTNPTISLTATGGGTYSWNNSLGSNATVTVNTAGTYTVTVTAANGCTATASITITANQTKPSADIINNSSTAVLSCTAPSIGLTATGNGTYSWNNGLGTNATVTVITPGTYTVTVTAANGCTETKSVTITSDASLPIAAITNNIGTTILTCTTPSISLTATGGATYSWDNGLGTNAGVTVTLAGTYTVTVTSSNGCSATASITITESKNLPTVNVTNADICLGGSATLTASGADSYTWSTSETGSTITVLPTASTTYTVEGTVTATGCKNTARATVYVESPIGLTLNAPRSIELGNELTITVTAERTDHGYFEWFLNDQPYKTVSEYSLTLVPAAGKQHFLVHTATTKLNCPSSSEIYVEVSESVPNVINPYNPNGRNCCFMIGYHVEIYNRYMQKVFEGNDGWDGTYRGAIADPGTYFYRLYKKGGQVEKGTLEVVKF